MRVELPRGQWAEFRDITELRGGDAKAIRRASRFRVNNGVLEEVSMGIADDQMDALLARIIKSWSLAEFNLPMFDISSLDEIPLDTYNALVDAAEPYKDAINKVGKAPTMLSGTSSTVTSAPETPEPSTETSSTPSTTS